MLEVFTVRLSFVHSSEVLEKEVCVKALSAPCIALVEKIKADFILRPANVYRLFLNLQCHQSFLWCK